MLTPLRAEVNALLAETPVRRKAALRRSDAPDALLATDLPYAAAPADAADFIERAEAAGWAVNRAENGWLLLDKPVPVPVASVPERAEGACGCCLSLLLRHPDDGSARELIRELVRAEEAGNVAFERFCTALHSHLAALLRLRQPLPGALLPYLAHAYATIADRRK